MAERETRWRVLGGGSVANRFAHGLTVVKGSTLVAAASRTPGRAREFAERHGIASFFENYEDPPRRADIDAVYVATTHNFHHDNVGLALEHGESAQEIWLVAELNSHFVRSSTAVARKGFR